MPSLKTLILSAALLFACVVSAEAQYRRASYTSSNGLRTLGLERAWQTQIQFDATRGKLAGMNQHISATRGQTIYEVKYPGGRITFSDRDLDPFRKPLGEAGAKQKAEDWVATWKTRNPDAKQEPEIKKQVVPDVVIVAASESGMVQCINGETGRTLWTTKVGSSRHPTMTPAINEKFVAVINGTTLYMLDREDGQVRWERRTTHPAGAGAGLSDTLIFIPMVNGHVEIFYVNEPRRPAAFFQSSGRCLVQPTIFRGAVAWPTDAGKLYVGNSEVPGVRFRISASETIRSAPTFRAGSGDMPEMVYFASADGYVYAAETAKGGIVHRFSAGEPISESPVVVKDKVFAVTENGTLFCFSAEDSEELWFVSGINRFLAANNDRLYCLDRNNRLVGLDAKSGSILGTADLGGIDFSFLNTQSDRIYVGTTTGVLHCLHEAGLPYPVVHGGMEPKKQLPQVIQKADDADDKAPATDEKPAMDDADPFDLAPKPKADEPKPEPAKEDDDPFAP